MTSRAQPTGIVFLLTTVAFQFMPRAAHADSDTFVDSDTFSKHVVVAQEGHAADVGRDVLAKGGNAIDAAIATAFALAVTFPRRETWAAAASSSPTWRTDARSSRSTSARRRPRRPRHDVPGPDGKPRPATGPGLGGRRAGDGPRPGAGPRAIRQDPLGRAGPRRPPGWRARASRSRPTWPRSLNRQLTPPRENQARHRPRDDFGRLGDFPESVAAFGKPDGTPWKAGDRLIQRDLADTLDRIADGRPRRVLHRPDRRADRRATWPSNGGFITLDDLEAIRPSCGRPSTRRSAASTSTASVPRPRAGSCSARCSTSSNGTTCKADGRESPGRCTASPRPCAGLLHPGRQASPTPTSSRSPSPRLISKAYADELAQSISDRATPSRRLAPFPDRAAESGAHDPLSTHRPAGNAVALTYTLEDCYGAKCVVAGAGFLLNNEMGDFNLIPGRTDAAGRIGTPANQIAPGKRMLSSQTPTIVLKDGQVRLVTGSPGGRTIPNTTLWVVLNVLEFGSIPERPSTHRGPITSGSPTSSSSKAAPGPMERAPPCAAWGTRLKVSIGRESPTRSSSIAAEQKLLGIADRRRSTAKASGD